MSLEQTAVVPAGWYPDPHGIAELRWWDSARWTDNIHPPAAPPPASAPASTPPQTVEADFRSQQDLANATPDVVPTMSTSTDLPTPTPTNNLPSRRELRERGEIPTVSGELPAMSLAESSPAESALVPAHTAAPTPETDSSVPATFDWLTGAGTAPEPVGPAALSAASTFASAAAGSASNSDSAWNIEPYTAAPDGDDLYNDANLTRTSTASGWLIALMPLIAGVLAIAAIKGAENYPRYVPPAATWWMLAAGVLVLLYFATLLLAAFDRRKLDNIGHPYPAHWAWALLTAPIYLLVRTITVRRDSGRGSVLLWMWIAFAVVVIGGYFLTGYLAPELTAGYTLPFL